MKKTVRPPGGFSWEGRPQFFTELMRLHNWPPGFIPTALKPGELDNFGRSRLAAKARDVQLQNGYTGSISGISKKANDRLEQYRDVMVKQRARKA
jgi:hypothetical protein